MDSIERIMYTFEGKPVDRVPTFCATMEDRTFNEVLGKPFIPGKLFFKNPLTAFLLDKWGPRLSGLIAQPSINRVLEKRIKAAVLLGFDAVWASYDESFIFLDSKIMARCSGGFFNVCDDGYGNVSYRYIGPSITSREEFEAWPYWPDPDAFAHRTYTFFRKIVSKYGDNACLFGQASAYGIFESFMWALGVERALLWIMKERDLAQRHIERAETLCLKVVAAIMDAGVRVILQPDDFAYKSGPFLNPKLIDELFGPSYRRLIKSVHDRGGKFVFHSCGDNTLLFDTYIGWGVDGLHAYETTSNVNIFNEKKKHGWQTVIIGGVGIDYLLTERSKDEEVAAHVKRLIKELGPGGRYIVSPAYSLSSIPAHKLRVMIDAVHQYGKYPLTIQ